MEPCGEDGDTIKLKEPKDEEIKVSEIYNGETGNTGSYSENKEKIKQLEDRVAELEKALEDSSKTEGEQAQELAELKTILAQTTATEERILKGYTAYKGGSLITGTMEDRGELNWNPSSSTSKTIEPGYYSGGTISTANAYNEALSKASMKYESVGSFSIRSTTAPATFDVSGYPGYQNFRRDNFYISWGVWMESAANLHPVITYNSSTGILTVSCTIDKSGVKNAYWGDVFLCHI